MAPTESPLLVPSSVPPAGFHLVEAGRLEWYKVREIAKSDVGGLETSGA